MSVNIDKNSECKNSGEFGYISVSVRSLVWLIIVIGTENPPPSLQPATSLRNDGGSIGEKAFQRFQCEIHLFCWQFEIHRAFRRQWQGRDTPSIIIIKQAAGRQATQHHPSWVIKILGTQKCWLKIMLELESMKWNTSFNCVVLTKRQVCFDSYLWPLSLHKVTIEHAYNWAAKREDVKRRRCHCFSFRMVLKPRGGVWVVHMWELIRIDVTVSAMNHTGCDWAEFEWWINCWNRVTRQSCKECWVTLRCIWASKCSFNCIVNAVTVIECESFIAIVTSNVTVTVLEIFVCCKQRGCLKLAGN